MGRFFNKTKVKETMELIIDGNRGIFTPQQFCRITFTDTNTFNCDPEDIQIVMQGPDNSEYWDAWDNIVNDFNDNGKTIYQDQDIWIVEEGEVDQQIDSDLAHLKSLE